MLSRRKFLRSGVMTALSVSVAVGAGRLAFGQQKPGGSGNRATEFAVPSEARQETLFNYNQAAFESYLGSTFTALGANGRTVELKLVSVTGFTANTTGKTSRVRTTERTRTPQSECFNLSFSASGALPTFTTIHTLHHDALGDIDLFVTEQKNESGELVYEAVINHTDATSAPRTPIYQIEKAPKIIRLDETPRKPTTPTSEILQ